MGRLEILWSEGDWRCELYPEADGTGWLKILKGDHLIVIESAFGGEPPLARAEILRSTFCGTPKQMD
jgi:hypothetical protein